MIDIFIGALIAVGTFVVTTPLVFGLQRRRRRKRDAAAIKLPALSSELAGPFRARGRK